MNISSPKGLMEKWLGSIGLNGQAQGYATWQTEHLFNGCDVLSIQWCNEAITARHVITMPEEEPHVQWQVTLRKVNRRWQCLHGSHARDVAEWRSLIRETVRGLAVKPTIQPLPEDWAEREEAQIDAHLDGTRKNRRIARG